MLHPQLAKWRDAARPGIEHELEHYLANAAGIRALPEGVDVHGTALQESHVAELVQQLPAFLLEIADGDSDAASCIAAACATVVHGTADSKAAAVAALSAAFSNAARDSVARCVALNWWLGLAAHITAGMPNSLEAMETSSAALQRLSVARRNGLQAAGWDTKDATFRRRWRGASEALEDLPFVARTEQHEALVAMRLFHAGVRSLNTSA